MKGWFQLVANNTKNIRGMYEVLLFCVLIAFVSLTACV